MNRIVALHNDCIFCAYLFYRNRVKHVLCMINIGNVVQNVDHHIPIISAVIKCIFASKCLVNKEL